MAGRSPARERRSSLPVAPFRSSTRRSGQRSRYFEHSAALVGKPKVTNGPFTEAKGANLCSSAERVLVLVCQRPYSPVIFPIASVLPRAMNRSAAPVIVRPPSTFEESA